jgi:Ca2+:H+ antiporter
MWINLLLLFVPISLVVGYWLNLGPLWTFGTAVVAIVPLAEWIRRATEQLAETAGPAIGGLLNVTFGNMAEVVLALVVLLAGHTEVVKAQITGSIIGNGLLGLGLAIVVGSIGRDKQRFNRERAGLLSSLLILSLIGLLVPALFNYTEQALVSSPEVGRLDENLSLGVSIVLILIYGANLVYTLYTDRDVYAEAGQPGQQEGDGQAAGDDRGATDGTGENGEKKGTAGALQGKQGGAREGKQHWSLWQALGVLLGATALIALESELVSRGLEGAASQLGISTFFLGVVVLAVIGNAAEYLAAVYFARQNQMGVVLGITVGSTIQIALLGAPLLVLVSFLIGHPMNLVFENPLELIAVAGVALVVDAIAHDGETNWFEGVLLLGVYAILVLAFFFATPPA